MTQFISIGETIEMEGFELTATVEPDEHTGPPWKEHDGHGPVTGWVTRDKHPGERVVNQDVGSYRYYDFAEACRIAQRDGWGVEGGRRKGESAKAYATRAAEQDYEVMRSWANDEWCWVGVVVTASRKGIELGSASLWGIESEDYPGSDGSYLVTVANEIADEALDEAKAKLASLVA